ncbi:MAG TPA: hypothetical protein VJL58_00050 [Pyrinomonadaceae bacterium]|nr:hypothetical protein [Pyrinomonadaceae bacterium]
MAKAAMVGLALICSLVVLLIDYRGVAVVIFSAFSILIVFLVKKLYVEDTSENWWKLSWSDIARSVLGGTLMLLGWVGFLRSVLATAVAAILLKMD